MSGCSRAGPAFAGRIAGAAFFSGITGACTIAPWLDMPGVFPGRVESVSVADRRVLSPGSRIAAGLVAVCGIADIDTPESFPGNESGARATSRAAWKSPESDFAVAARTPCSAVAAAGVEIVDAGAGLVMTSTQSANAGPSRSMCQAVGFLRVSPGIAALKDKCCRAESAGRQERIRTGIQKTAE